LPVSTEQAVLVAIVDRDEAQLLLRLARVRDQVATMSRYGFGERVTARSTLKDPGRMESSDAERYLLVCRSLFARPSRPASVYRTRSFRLSVARSQQAPEMMKTYSHIRREALNQAAVALEPSKPVTPAPGVPAPAAAAPTATHVTKADFKREGALAVISGLGRGELFGAARQQNFPRQLVCVGLYLPERGELL